MGKCYLTRERAETMTLKRNNPIEVVNETYYCQGDLRKKRNKVIGYFIRFDKNECPDRNDEAFIVINPNIGTRPKLSKDLEINGILEIKVL